MITLRNKMYVHSMIEWFSITERRKTKTKAITPTNHKGRRQLSEPIRI